MPSVDRYSERHKQLITLTLPVLFSPVVLTSSQLWTKEAGGGREEKKEGRRRKEGGKEKKNKKK